jgi:TolA-binding protein
MARRLVLALLLTSCVTASAVEDSRPDENDADARGAEHEELAQLLAKNPDSPKVLLRLAELEATQGRVDEHKAAERKTIAAEAKARGNPTVHEAQVAEAQKLEAEATQLREQAAAHYDQFAKKFPTDHEAPLALFSLAEVEGALHHDDRAAAALDRILLDYPASPIAFDAHLMRAEKLFEASDMAGAVKEYDAAR